MINYNPKLHIEYAMQLLEKDVCFLSRKYFIDGYDQEDLQQELRLWLWTKLKNYNYDKAGLRAWGDKVMRNHLSNLLERSKAQKRGILVALDIEKHKNELDLDLLIDKFTEKGKKVGDYL